MVIWVFFFVAGPLVLFGYIGYLCRGRRHPHVTKQQIQELQALYDLEHREEPR